MIKVCILIRICHIVEISSYLDTDISIKVFILLANGHL